MKYILVTLFFVCSFAEAAYRCEGPKKTTLESFEIGLLSASNIDTSLDGGFDVAEEDKSGLVHYTYNNGCDNEIYFRISNLVSKYEPQVFAMRMDYLTQDEILMDVEVHCYQIQE